MAWDHVAHRGTVGNELARGIYYDGDNLMVDVLVKSEANCDGLETAMGNLPSFNIDTCRKDAVHVLSKNTFRIWLKDYRFDDSSSPLGSSIEGSTTPHPNWATTFGSFQRLEAPTATGCEQAHLISERAFRDSDQPRHPLNKKPFDKGCPDNFLALSPNTHTMFDGNLSSVVHSGYIVSPFIIMPVEDTDYTIGRQNEDFYFRQALHDYDHPLQGNFNGVEIQDKTAAPDGEDGNHIKTAENRVLHRVNIRISWANTENPSFAVNPGHESANRRHIFTFVYVQNPSTFRACLRWKARSILTSWGYPEDNYIAAGWDWPESP
jgi:hypothetical protein